jgi:hypothetical protein
MHTVCINSQFSQRRERETERERELEIYREIGEEAQSYFS